MTESREWETRTLQCPEGEDHTAMLLVERQKDGDALVIKSISCDNPRLCDMDHATWDCRWSCWGKLAEELE